MSANSKIEWTDHTFNPWIGCTKVSPACDNYNTNSSSGRARQGFLRHNLWNWVICGGTNKAKAGRELDGMIYNEFPGSSL